MTAYQSYPRLLILVTGGRDYQDAARVREVLEPYARVGNVLMTGGARGADRLASAFWYSRQLPYITVPAPWDRMGRAAGMARNISMLRGTAISPHAETVPDLVIAFPGGRGTAGCVAEARKRSIPVKEIR